MGNEELIIADGDTEVNLTRIISLNPTAARLWREVEGKSFTAGQLADYLTEWYDTNTETARQDADKLIEQWIAAGLTE